MEYNLCQLLRPDTKLDEAIDACVSYRIRGEIYYGKAKIPTPINVRTVFGLNLLIYNAITEFAYHEATSVI